MATEVTIVGNVGGTPERRTTSKGDAFARFRVGSSERRFDDGKWVDGPPSWYEVAAYGVLAENALASIEKGHRVVVHGDLTIREWSAQDGSRRITPQIRATAVGHDLLFGVARFERVKRQAPAAVPIASSSDPDSPVPPAAPAVPQVDLSDVWGAVLAPGSAPSTSSDELVGVGADDVPF